jgi:hypothetical protein
LSRAHATADRTETEAREWERNRVAWNLPQEVTRAQAIQAPEAAKKTEPLPDAKTAAADG